MAPRLPVACKQYSLAERPKSNVEKRFTTDKAQERDLDNTLTTGPTRKSAGLKPAFSNIRKICFG